MLAAAQSPAATHCVHCDVALCPQALDAAAAELASAAPNLKALEQYEAIRDKERQQVSILPREWKATSSMAHLALQVN
jgi:hypothetical protein